MDLPRGKVYRTINMDWTFPSIQNSPTLFDKALSADLLECRQSYPRSTLLQYVDDLLIASETEEERWEGGKTMLSQSCIAAIPQIPIPENKRQV